jgi:hypothetical protein
MKNKTKLTGAELNCIEIAVQHHIDELEDALADTGTGWKSAYKKDEYKMLKERLKATQSVKKKLWNLGGLAVKFKVALEMLDSGENKSYHILIDTHDAFAYISTEKLEEDKDKVVNIK